MIHFSPVRVGLVVLCVMAMPALAADSAATSFPAITVVSSGVPGENKIVGTYSQPEWSARRPFPGVSVYVQPAAQIELEMGFEDTTTPFGIHHRELIQEVEAGLGHRLQLAFENSFTNFRERARQPSRWREDALRVSMRYALADWGKLPLNPAVGASWRFNSGTPDAPGAQLVFGDELTPRLHWAADFQYARQTGEPRLHELTAAAALTYSITNETLNVGVQAQWKRSREALEPQSIRSELGPCLQYRPIDQFHIDCVALCGHERSRSVHGLVISIGLEFGEGADDHDDDREHGGRFTH